MTDIVARLREIFTGPTVLAAADEIERLRAELAGLHEWANARESVLRDLAFERLRAEAAERKIDVLRDALAFYSERMTYVARSGMECGITRDHFGERARAALKETGDE